MLKQICFKLITSITVFTFIFTSTCSGLSFAQETETSSAENSAQTSAVNLPESTSAPTKHSGSSQTDVTTISGRSPYGSTEQFQVEPQNGSANLTIPLDIPQGRKGIQPDLTLRYNSSAQNGWLGTGWILELGAIQRSTKDGVPHYNLTDDTFVFAQSGSSEELVNIGTNQYRFKIESSFNKIEFFNSSYWVLTDKSGIKYYFGQTQSSQQYDPANQTRIFKWSLDKVEDLFGNYLTVTYQKIENQIYPQYVDYTGNSLQSVLPYARVEFEMESTNRTDIITSHKANFLVKTIKRLANIYVKTSNVLQRKYQFNYNYVLPTNRSVLSSIVQYDNTGTNSLPATSFVYQGPPSQFTEAVSWTTNWTQWFVNALGNGGAFTGDFNGDGLTDIAYYNQGDLNVGLSNGSVFTEPVSWTTNWTQWFVNALGNGGAFTGDFNGDGLMDIAYYNQGDLNVGLSNGEISYLLTSISNNIGATTQITYTPSTEYDNTGSDNLSDLPFPVPVVSQITVTDQTLAQSYTTNYEYKDGYFDAPDREFRGFELVTTTDADSNYRETEFLQDDIYQGRIKEQRSYDSLGNLYLKIVNTWASQNLYPNVNFAYLSQVDNYTFDGDLSGRRSQIQYFYEENPQYGNLTKFTELGEVDLTSGDDLSPLDNRISQTEYVYNPTSWIVYLPKAHYIQDQGNNVLKQDWLYYDGLAYGESPTLGSLTKQENWLKTSTNLTPIPSNDENPKTTFTYDAYGNLLTTTDPIGNATPLPNDRTTIITYDPDYFLFPLTTTNPLGHIVSTAYYGINGVPLNDGTYQGLWGQIKSNSDANNVTSYTIYDNFGRPVKVVGPYDTPELPTTLIEYNLSTIPINVVTHSRIEHGQPQTLDTVAFYDGLGRLIQTKSSAEEGVAHPYIASLSVAFNERGQAEKKYLNFYSDTFNTYTAPEGQAPYATLTYDAIGRQTELVNPDSSYNNITYQDWTTTVVDENGHMKKSYFDTFGRLITVEEYTGADGRNPAYYPQTQGSINNYYTLYSTTDYSYDIQNNLIQVTDALGNITTISYDSLNRKAAMDDPDMGNWGYQYDLVGNLINQTDAKNQTITFEYDDINRLTQKLYNSINPTNPVNYTYDDLAVPYSKGRLTKIDYGSEYTKYYYDALGREVHLVNKIGTEEYHTYKSYDALNRLKTLTYPNNEVLTYVYNSQGQIESVRNQNNYYYVSASSYNQNNQRTSINYGNNTQTTYDYNPLNLRLTHLLTQNNQGQTLQNLTYDYDALGNIVSLTDSVNSATQIYFYDALNRLIMANNAVYGFKVYAYDEIGNILNKDNLIFTYGAGNAGPHAVTALSNGTTYGYDENGNMISQSTVNGIYHTYEYDCENRLKTIKRNGTTLAAFEYDGNGGRIKKTIYQNLPDIKLTNSSPDDGHSSSLWARLALFLSKSLCILKGLFTTKEAEAARYGSAVSIGPTSVSTIYVSSLFEKAGNTTTEHIFLGPQRIATVSGSSINYFHTNHLSSTDTITNSSGTEVVHYEYSPYGSIVVKSGEDVTRYKFTGQEFDDETGLYFYKARYYHPLLGRFITPDTIIQAPNNPQTLNRYSYCLNNPINYTDPTGHFIITPLIVFALGCAGIYGLITIGQNIPAGRNPVQNLGKAEVAGFAGGLVMFKASEIGNAALKNPVIQEAVASTEADAAIAKVAVEGTAGAIGDATTQYIMKDGQVDIRSSLAAGGTCLLPITPMVKGMGSKLATTLYDAGLVDKAGKNTISKLSSQSSFLFEAGTSTFLAEISSSANSHQEIMCVAPSKRTSELNFKREESYACWVPVVSNKTSNESPSDGAYGGASGGPSGGSGGGGYYFNEELGRPMPNPPPP